MTLICAILISSQHVKCGAPSYAVLFGGSSNIWCSCSLRCSVFCPVPLLLLRAKYSHHLFMTSLVHLTKSSHVRSTSRLRCLFIYLCTQYIVWTVVAQIGRSLVRFPMVSLEFFIDIILPIALSSTQPLTEMSTRGIFWG